MSGWILLHRKFFEHPIWSENREFSRAEAWIDLIAQARWKDTETSAIINGQIIKWGRGQLIGSVRFLRKRWRWKSTKKVHTFLKLLENENMVSLEKVTPATRITICNYDTYQQAGNSKETARKQQGNKTGKKEKEGRKKVNIAFGVFWDSYGKKAGSKKKAKEYWHKLSDEDRQTVMAHLQQYVYSFDDIQYQPYATTFLNQRYFDSEDYKKNGQSKIGIEAYL
jgi:hypothetical protein